VASDRLLERINKGVSIEKVSKVTQSLSDAGIMVHAYLMYGFPTQTEQETIDALEVVRQLFNAGIVQSAYWHRFSMTAHSPIGIQPQEFGVNKETEEIGAFANNDLFHNDPDGGDHSKFGYGLRKSLLNFMHGMGFDSDLQDWFDFKIPKTIISNSRINNYLNANEFHEVNPNHRLIWTGNKRINTTKLNAKNMQLSIDQKSNTLNFELPQEQATWLVQLLQRIHTSNPESLTYSKIEQDFNTSNLGYFLLFWNEPVIAELRKNGLLLL
jgi:hypothetical protein